jgi:hypothetical protein
MKLKNNIESDIDCNLFNNLRFALYNKVEDRVDHRLYIIHDTIDIGIFRPTWREIRNTIIPVLIR